MRRRRGTLSYQRMWVEGVQLGGGVIEGEGDSKDPVGKEESAESMVWKAPSCRRVLPATKFKKGEGGARKGRKEGERNRLREVIRRNVLRLGRTVSQKKRGGSQGPQGKKRNQERMRREGERGGSVLKKKETVFLPENSQLPLKEEGKSARKEGTGGGEREPLSRREMG